MLPLQASVGSMYQPAVFGNLRIMGLVYECISVWFCSFHIWVLVSLIPRCLNKIREEHLVSTVHACMAPQVFCYVSTWYTCSCSQGGALNIQPGHNLCLKWVEVHFKFWPLMTASLLMTCTTMNVQHWLIVFIVWVLLLGVHYLDILLQLKLHVHACNQNNVSVSCSWRGRNTIAIVYFNK